MVNWGPFDIWEKLRVHTDSERRKKHKAEEGQVIEILKKNNNSFTAADIPLGKIVRIFVIFCSRMVMSWFIDVILKWQKKSVLIYLKWESEL